MKSKGLKFTIMTIFVLVLIAAYFGVGMLVAPPVQANNTVVDDPLDGLPAGDIEDGTDLDDEYSDEEIILPADPLALVNYALSDLRTSAGYTGEIKINFNATGSWGSFAELRLQQLIKGNIEHSGRESLEEFFFYYNEQGVSSFLLNLGYIYDEYRAIYTNSQTDESFVVGTKNYNLKDETYDLSGDTRFEARDYQGVFDQYKIIYSLPLNMTFTKSNSYCSGYPSETSRYKSIQIKVYNTAIPYECRSYYNGLCGDIPVIDQNFFKGLTYTFVIDKKTGELERMIVQHDIQGGVSVLGSQANVKALVQYQIDYTIMDEAFEVSKPHLESPKYEEYLISLEEEQQTA